MATEVRSLRSDAEYERHAFISHYAFNQKRDEAAFARRRTYYDSDWCLGAFDAGEMVAGLVVIPFEQYVSGANIRLGGIASVSCLPERRRGGHVGALLRESLASMRDAGQVLSGLYTPHYSLYRKFGWEIASRMLSYSFPPKVTRPRMPQPAGSFQRVAPDAWQRLATMHAAHYAIRNGAFARTEKQWRNHVFSDYGIGERDAVIWSNAGGEERGYLVYESRTRPAPGSPFGETILRVHDWVALDAEAYAAILGYALSHDLADHVLMLTSQDEPLFEALEEPVHVKQPPGAWPGMMLRLVDVPRAIEARPAMPHASGAAVTIALTDAAAPWNEGTWHIACGSGRVSVERTKILPDLEMDVRALAPIYNGFVRPIDAIRVGSVRGSDGGAVEALTAIFAPNFSPYSPDDF